MDMKAAETALEITEKAGIEVITPEMASDLLARNYEDNRNIRPSYVAQLANVMRQGRYVSQNGQTIVVGADDGILYDGQHRLSAVVESGIPQPFIVAYILDGKNAYKTIDNGTRREAADFLSMPNKKDCAAVGKFMACVEWGSAGLLSCLQGKWDSRTQVDRGIIIAYVEQHADEIDHAVRVGRAMRGAAFGPRTAYAQFLLLLEYCGTDAYLNDFIKDFSKAASGNTTVTATKTAILKAHAKGSKKPEKKWVLGTLLDGYLHFCEDDGSTMINKQSLRLKQYQRYMEHARESRRCSAFGKGCSPSAKADDAS